MQIRFNTVNGKYCCNAMADFRDSLNEKQVCFNTVNGKYCCNVSEIIAEVGGRSKFQYRKR